MEPRNFKSFKEETALLKCQTLFARCLNNKAYLTSPEEPNDTVVKEVCNQRFDDCIKASFPG